MIREQIVGQILKSIWSMVWDNIEPRDWDYDIEKQVPLHNSIMFEVRSFVIYSNEINLND